MINTKKPPHNELQKITINIPKQLLEDAQNIEDTNITETIKKALKFMIAAEASQNIRKMRGKVKFSINVNKLREDR